MYSYVVDGDEDVHQCGRCKQLFLKIEDYMFHKKSKTCRKAHSPTRYLLNFKEPQIALENTPIPPVQNDDESAANWTEPSVEDDISHETESKPRLAVHRTLTSVAESLLLKAHQRSAEAAAATANASEPAPAEPTPPAPPVKRGRGRPRKTEEQKRRDAELRALYPKPAKVVKTKTPRKVGRPRKQIVDVYPSESEEDTKRVRRAAKKDVSYVDTSFLDDEDFGKFIPASNKSTNKLTITNVTKEIKRDIALMFETKEALGLENFSCKLCGKTTAFRDELSRHLRRVHGISKYMCERCGSSFRDNYKLKRHMSTKICKKKASTLAVAKDSSLDTTFDQSEADVSNISTENESPIGKAIFPIQNKLFTTKEKKWRRMTDTVEYHCTVCSDVFSSYEEIILHIGLHPDCFPGICRFCGKWFVSRYKLWRHVTSSVHDNLTDAQIRQFKAEISRQKITNQCKIQMLYPSANDQKFECIECNQIFLKKTDLNSHIRIIHYGFKPKNTVFHCNSCMQQFYKRQHLLLHLGEVHHIRDTQAQTCFCLVCQKFFKQKSHIYRHRETLHLPLQHITLEGTKSLEADLMESIEKEKSEACAEDQAKMQHMHFACFICCQTVASKTGYLHHLQQHRVWVPKPKLEGVDTLPANATTDMSMNGSQVMDMSVPTQIGLETIKSLFIGDIFTNDRLPDPKIDESSRVPMSNHHEDNIRDQISDLEEDDEDDDEDDMSRGHLDESNDFDLGAGDTPEKSLNSNEMSRLKDHNQGNSAVKSPSNDEGTVNENQHVESIAKMGQKENAGSSTEKQSNEPEIKEHTEPKIRDQDESSGDRENKNMTNNASIKSMDLPSDTAHGSDSNKEQGADNVIPNESTSISDAQENGDTAVKVENNSETSDGAEAQLDEFTKIKTRPENDTEGHNTTNTSTSENCEGDNSLMDSSTGFENNTSRDTPPRERLYPVPLPEEYSCLLCDATFKSLSEFYGHKFEEHNLVPVFRCIKETCRQIFLYTNNYRKHVDVHPQTAFICRLCNDHFESLSELVIHKNSVHKLDPESLTNRCNVCYKVFQSKEALQEHVSSDQHHHQCSQCGKVFKCPRDLNTHEMRHMGIRSFLCDICGATFYSKMSLNRHRSTHNPDKNFKCPDCDQAFRKREHLRRHMKTRHSDYAPFKCTHEGCGRAFKRKDKLTEHLRTHLVSKPFTCEVCGKGYRNRDSLKYHSKSHLQSMDYICSICTIGFGKVGQLHAHLKEVHSVSLKDKSVYPCNMCDEVFPTPDGIRKHVQDVHGFTMDTRSQCVFCLKWFATEKNMMAHTKKHHMKMSDDKKSQQQQQQHQQPQQQPQHSPPNPEYNNSQTNERPASEHVERKPLDMPSMIAFPQHHHHHYKEPVQSSFHHHRVDENMQQMHEKQNHPQNNTMPPLPHPHAHQGYGSSLSASQEVLQGLLATSGSPHMGMPPFHQPMAHMNSSAHGMHMMDSGDMPVSMTTYNAGTRTDFQGNIHHHDGHFH